MGKSSINGPFSMAMSNNQRVNSVAHSNRLIVNLPELVGPQTLMALYNI